VRLLIDDTFATGTYTVPVASGWVSPPAGIAVEVVAGLAVEAIGAGDSALVSPATLSKFHGSHDVVSAVAVIADGVSAIAMRTPVRPDDVDTTPVRLLDVGGAAELLARATLQPFYGIEATGWVRDSQAPEAARAQVVIVEGEEALREPEGGFSEDLSRAWFILTAQPVVTHVLLVPRAGTAATTDIITFLDAVRLEGLARRRQWRPQLADALDIGRDRASVFWTAQRLMMDDEDRRAMLDLLTKGSWGTSRASPLQVRFRDGTGVD